MLAQVERKMSDWQENLHQRLTQIRNRKERKMAKQEEMPDVEVVYEEPLVYEVVSLGWGLRCGDVIMHTGSKGDCIKQARADAKETGGEVVVTKSDGNVVRREYYTGN